MLWIKSNLYCPVGFWKMVCGKAQTDPLGYVEISQREETNVEPADYSNRCGDSERAI